MKEAERTKITLNLVDNTHKKNKDAGFLYVRRLVIEPSYSFIDYLSSGLEVSLIVSLDFTGSNGDPKSPSSLHYAGQFNEYEMATRAIGDILSYYDADKMFPAYGFGAMMPTGQVSHCFALNGNPSNPFSAGVDGILRDYRQALNTVQLYGPTNFAPTIQTAMAYANQAAMEQSQQNQKYMILLIITDGEITDMPDTIREIVKASTYPLSIVIVGVGSANFDSMEQLDGDGKALRSGSTVAVRDIVQFVPFRKYGQNHQALASETLREIPEQVVQYFKTKGIKPKNKM